MTLSVQFLTMFAMVSSGFYLGLILETYRRLSIYWKKHVILTYTMEILFWLSQTLIVFYVLFRVNAGEIRFYVIIACLLGFSMYQALAAALYKRLLEQIIRMITAVYRFFERLVQALFIKPIKWIIIAIFTVIVGIVSVISKVLWFVLKIVFTPFLWLLKGLYKLLPKKIQNYLIQIAGFYSKMKNIINNWLKKVYQKRR
ncbi:spore cortex biosynthesis protein YabQ [Oceanobacillus piezotolerans]|uniref:Spore cortex biosynthesis protein YabQ n=1 Tax=Oceanobacillus piezotolerans TaxID=2448030 RepID=A0A498D5D3_9BACI|nr:spore cortex biosynthesis protein YabQ [Oceanobacillus piezotolerans]RLL41675.1 spore cortex biosynthesis protein YabQ [Oceanobacillus piezotolerans]